MRQKKLKKEKGEKRDVMVSLKVSSRQREEWQKIANEIEAKRGVQGRKGRKVHVGHMLLEAAYLGLPKLLESWDKELAVGIANLPQHTTDLERAAQLANNLLRDAYAKAYELKKATATSDGTSDGATGAGSCCTISTI